MEFLKIRYAGEMTILQVFRKLGSWLVQIPGHLYEREEYAIGSLV
jgi:hypothetical protein